MLPPDKGSDVRMWTVSPFKEALASRTGWGYDEDASDESVKKIKKQRLNKWNAKLGKYSHPLAKPLTFFGIGSKV